MSMSVRKSSVNYQKVLWLHVREGSLADVELALAQLKKNGGNINSRDVFGLTPLHIAVWRNHIPVVRRLLEAGADPDARDGESGWSSLHRALHFGHLAVASLLLQSGASITLEDPKSRTPIDLLSGPVSQVVGEEQCSATEVFSWGSGVNYQLGTGNTHIQKLPCKVDYLHGSYIKLISAAKFHSVAVSASGEVYTWGFGRGGRLGHPDFDIHSGQAAIITPRQVCCGLGSRRVKAVAAAKHHTVVATEGGEVFTWGSNREGQLGYTSVDTQPTPRRVSSLRSKIVAVAAANKHTAVVSDCGEVYTWGCNREGQLGYGTSNSASNYTPRVVEYLKGKSFRDIAAAKYHTIVLGVDGEVYTWGHRLVTPRRVVIARNIKKSGSTPLKFHRMERLHVVSIAAGMVHSLALTDDGALFYWVSSDPDLRCQQLYSMCGKNGVSISAGKYWTTVVTSTGDIYMWDGKKGKDKPPVTTRLHGIKRATSVSVGETHMLIVTSLYHPPPNLPVKARLNVTGKQEESEEDSLCNDVEGSMNLSLHLQENDAHHRPLPSLKSLCEKVAVENLVEPRNAIQLLDIAESLGADVLAKYCEDIVIRNLDYILTVSAHAMASASLDILAKLEQVLDCRSSEPWSYRRLPTPTATFPAIINSEEDDSESEFFRTRDNHLRKSIVAMDNNRGQKFDSFLNPADETSQGISKQVRNLRKKLQQIEMLELKQSSGLVLDDQQIAKLHTRATIENMLIELGVPVETTPDRCSKRDGKSKKQRRKSKQRSAQVGMTSVMGVTDVKAVALKDVVNIETTGDSNIKEQDSPVEASVDEEIKNKSLSSSVNKDTSVSKCEFSLSILKEDITDSSGSKASLPVTVKKKNRKGGLSMFLSGALDDTPKVAPPPTPKIEGPAWGGQKIAKGSTSLKVIQDEQRKTREVPLSGKGIMEESSDSTSDGKIRLSSFLPSSPIPVVSAHSLQVFESERSTAPWASGTPPLLSRPSLRDIQMREQGKQQHSLSHSPTTRTTGFSVATGQGSPSESSGVNRWYKPEVAAPSPIRSIQIEEKAMKEFKRYYSSVRIVKNQS